MFNLFRGLGAKNREPPTLVAIRRLGRPFRKVSDKRWELREPPLYGYLIRLQAWEFTDRAEFVVLADITIDRDWFQRGMAIWLLEENDKLGCGSIRLIDTRDGMTLALGRVCPLPLYSEAALSRVAADLLAETSRVLQKLIAMEFIRRRSNDDGAAADISP